MLTSFFFFFSKIMENDDLNLGCTHSPKKKKIFTHKIEETMSSTYKKRFQDFKMQGIEQM